MIGASLQLPEKRNHMKSYHHLKHLNLDSDLIVHFPLRQAWILSVTNECSVSTHWILVCFLKMRLCTLQTMSVRQSYTEYVGNYSTDMLLSITNECSVSNQFILVCFSCLRLCTLQTRSVRRTYTAYVGTCLRGML